MKLINNSTRNYMACNIILEAGKILEVNNEKAINLFLNQEGVEEYIDKAEINKLKKELKQLKDKQNKDKQTKNK